MPTDLRMPALGVAAWAGALAARPGWLLVAVAAVVPAGIALVAWRRGRGSLAVTLTGVVLVGVAVGAATTLRQQAVSTNPVADLAAERVVVTALGDVVSDPRPISGPGEERVALRLRVRVVRGRGVTHRLSTPVLVLGDARWRDARLGSRVRLTGRLAPADDADLAGLLAASSSPEVVRGPDVWWRGAAAVRAAIRDAVAHRGADERALVPALVDGDDADLPPRLEEEFRITGLTHLTAVSGTNLTLVVGCLLALGRVCGVRGRWELVLGLLGIAGFMLLVRTEPSCVRAAVMGAVGLVALGSNGRHRALRALGVAVVVLLLLDPSLAVTVGFALSVLATAGLVLLAPGYRDALARWLPQWLAEAIAVPTAAQLAVTPVIAAISGQVSLVAVGANLVVAPVVGPATVLGLAAGLVTLVLPAVGALLGTASAWCVSWIVRIAAEGSTLPGAAVPWEAGVASVAVLTVICLAVGSALPHVLRRPATGLACCALVLVVVAVRLPTPGWPPAGWVLVMCDVGQGDALALRTGPSEAVVVDAGPEPAAVDRCLDGLGVRRVPLVVLTHFHADHVDGLAGVLGGRSVGRVETSRVLDPAFGVDVVREAAREEGVPVTLASYGASRVVGEARLQTLWPEPGPTETGDDGGSANDASVVLLAEVRGVRLLLTGDVEPPGQAELARRAPGLEVDVLKVPHHGSRYQELGWLASLDPDVALVPVGEENDYGHPSGPVLDELRRSGARVYRTDLDGDLAVVADDDGRLRVAARD